MGRILHVNLSTGEIVEEELNWDIAGDYIGGRGYSAKLLYDNLKPRIDPLSPDNILIVSTGPLTGTNVPTSGRFCIASKSPLTGTIFDSQCGGTFGWAMKRSGFDLFIIKGRSEKPVYLYVKDGKAELRSAEHLTSKLTSEVEDILKSELSENVRVLSIGPAGENLVRIASIISDKHRAAGRGGLGAVMGSKNLKAIAVEGKRRIEVANPKALAREVKKVQEILRRNALTGGSLTRYGTGCLVNVVNKFGVFPTMNFNHGYFEHAENISGETLRERLLVKSEGCYACPIRCGRIIRLSKGIYKGELAGGPEYETLWSLGAQCGLSDLEEIAVANDLCNRYGIDTISFGNALGYLIEAHEKGLVDDKVLGDVKLDWGRVNLSRLVMLTALKEGIGEHIAEGVRRMSEKFGGEEFAMHVKGLELPAYDPRGAKGMGLAYATSNRGGCHLRAYMVMSEILSLPQYLDPLKYEGKPELVKLMQDVYAVLDSMIVCKFTSFALFRSMRYEPGPYARLLTTATGFFFDDEEFRKAGERIYNLERLFNVREGFSRIDDTLPKRLLSEPIPDGPAKGGILDLNMMLEEYYVLRGWDVNGVPTDYKLLSLGIITKPRWPKLQVALDLRDLDEALRIAEAAYRGGAEFLEAGTPLIKSVGIRCVSELKKRFPNAVVVADLKTLDVGWMETEIAAQAGADIVGISGLSNDNTIRDAVGCARKYGVKIMCDLIEVKDPLRRAKELEKLGVDFICLHSGIDAQRDREQVIDRKVETIKKIVESVDIPVAVAGGIRADTAAKVVKAGAKIIIVGGAITRASDPKEAASIIKRVIEAEYRNL